MRSILVLSLLTACSIPPAERLHAPQATPPPALFALEPFPAGSDAGWPDPDEEPAWPAVTPSLLPHGALPADPCAHPDDPYARAWCKPEWRDATARLRDLHDAERGPQASAARADTIDLLADSTTGADAVAILATREAALADWDALTATYMELGRYADAAELEKHSPFRGDATCDRVVRHARLLGDLAPSHFYESTDTTCVERIAAAGCRSGLALADPRDRTGGCGLYFARHPDARPRAVRAELAALWPEHAHAWRPWDALAQRALAHHVDDIAAAAILNLSRTAACDPTAMRELDERIESLSELEPTLGATVLARVSAAPACPWRP